uniref:Fe2OG dioxygenase domain-containing protein n=1 Tax=Aureoumbra lagunensis TaxID=44058 RepID=A0A7S3NPL9_9STRA|mmetsp:Transcript_9061/g.13952  ORF Transcript_9061/g.13952 Transcript_9061/m.13952 type:complete len:347 (-) Transcript_9061:689-1729(-)
MMKSWSQVVAETTPPSVAEIILPRSPSQPRVVSPSPKSFKTQTVTKYAENPPHAKEYRKSKNSSTFSHQEESENILQGLVLWRNIITEEKENELIDWVSSALNRKDELQGATYLQATHTQEDYKAGRKRTVFGRQVLQFGSFYDYQNHIIDTETPVEEMPPILDRIIDIFIKQGALPIEKRPDTCIINVYQPGDTIPPHVDDLAYPRPFSTLSLSSPASILLGTSIQPIGNSRYRAPVKIDLASRSLLVLQGIGGDKTKHCIPPCKEFRISLTFRRMPDWARRACDLRKQSQRTDTLCIETALSTSPPSEDTIRECQQPEQQQQIKTNKSKKKKKKKYYRPSTDAD